MSTRTAATLAWRAWGLAFTLALLFGAGTTEARAASAPITPTISSVSPDNGENNGSVVVTIRGSNFTSTATARLYIYVHKSKNYTINASSTTVVDSTKLKATFDLTAQYLETVLEGPGSPGTAPFPMRGRPRGTDFPNRFLGFWDVIVDNANGATTTLCDGFEVRRAGSTWVRSISPNRGATIGPPVETTITGEYFQNGATARLQLTYSRQNDGRKAPVTITIPATSTTFVSSTQLRATFDLSDPPDGKLGYWDVAVPQADGYTYVRKGIFEIYVRASNAPPAANAGSDQIVETVGGQAQVTLDGSGSWDPDDYPLTYTWDEMNGGRLAGPTSAPRSQVTLAQGTHTIRLMVQDGWGGFAIDYVTITVAGCKLVFPTQPSNTHPHQAISPPVKVALCGALTNAPITNQPVLVRLAKAGGTWNLGGTLQATTANGAATFGNLSVDTVAIGCRLSASATGVTSAVSNPFSVTADALTITAPSGGADWGIGIENPIRWTGSRGAGATVKVELSRNNGGSWTTLFASIADDGEVRWTATGPGTTQAQVRVTSVQFSGVSDTSDTFTIKAVEMSGSSPKLSFTGQPSDTAPSQAIAPPVVVTVCSSNPPGSDWVHYQPISVTVELCPTPTPATLLGTLTKPISNDDTVVFDDLRIAEPGRGYVLRAYTVWGGNQEDTFSESFDIAAPEPPADTTPPTIIPPADVSAEQANRDGTAVALGTPEVTDDTDPNPTVTNDAPAVFPLGVTTVTWTATDAAGNAATATQAVSIVDTTPPSLTVPPDITVEYDDPTDPEHTGQGTATDICDAAPVVTYTDAVLPGGDGLIRTWTATDAGGNTAEDRQHIFFEDTTPPDLTVPADVTAEQTSRDGTPVDIGQATTDDWDPDPVVTNDAPAVFPLGETIVTWTATDASGNVATRIQKVTVTDVTKPTLSVQVDDNPVGDGGSATAEQSTADGHEFVIGASSEDICDADVALSLAIDGGQPVAPAAWPVRVVLQLGVHTAVVTATDDSGNASTVSLTLTVKDTLAPWLVAPPDVMAEQADRDGTAVDLGAPQVQDICDANVTVTHDAPAKFPLGVTIVTWTATDDSGNVTTATQKVTIVDTTPPVLTAPADLAAEQTNKDGTPVATGEASAEDICDAAPAITNDAPAVFPLGETVVTWTARDASGNTATATQKVTVVDTTPPAVTTVTATPNTIWPPNKRMVPVTVTVAATDICDAAPVARIVEVTCNEAISSSDVQITGALTVSLCADRAGKGNGRIYTIHVSSTDASGNQSTATVDVTVPHDQGKR